MSSWLCIYEGFVHIWSLLTGNGFVDSAVFLTLCSLLTVWLKLFKQVQINW